MSLKLNRVVILIWVGLGAGSLLLGCLPFRGPSPQLPEDFEARLIFEDDFSRDLRQWHFEGNGKAVIEQGRLLMAENPGSQGILLWTRRDFEGDFQVEYDVEILNNFGISLIFICAQGINGEDILTELPPRTGAFEEYTQGQIRSYHLSYHRYFPDGRHNPGVNIRKNPGGHIVSHAEPDPCLNPGRYHITLRKVGANIRFWVNGKLIHNYTDKEEFGPVLTRGKIGLRNRGQGGVYKVYYDNFRVYQLLPKKPPVQ